MRRVLALAYKDLRLLLRDRMGFFFTLVWPLALAIFFGVMFGGGASEEPHGIPIAIVDEDSTEVSKAFIDSLSAAQELEVVVVSRQEALEKVRKAKVVAYVVLKKGFGEASRNPFWGEPPVVEVGSDPSRRAEGAMVEGILMKYASRRLQEFFSNPGAQIEEIETVRTAVECSEEMPSDLRDNLLRFFRELDRFLSDESLTQAEDSSQAALSGFEGFTPLKIEHEDVTIKRYGPRNAFAITFPQGSVWGLLAVAATFGISIVSERSKGTLLRLQVAPMSRFHILAGKAVACFIATVCLVSALFIIGYFGFGVKPDSPGLLAVAIISSGIAFVGIMMFLSVLGKTEQSVGGIAWGVLIILAMFGGGMVPLFFMPTWMRSVGTVSPVKWAVLAIEGAVWRGFTPFEILKPCLVLIGIGIGCFLIGVRAFRWTYEQS